MMNNKELAIKHGAKEILAGDRTFILMQYCELEAYSAELLAGASSEPVGKPLQWGESKNEWVDDKCGFHIYFDRDDVEGEQYTASWGEDNAESFGSLEEAKVWCQSELDIYIKDVAQPVANPLNQLALDDLARCIDLLRTHDISYAIHPDVTKELEGK